MHAIRTPILFLAGQADQLVPPHMMRLLYERSRGSAFKRFVAFPNGTHNDTWMCARPCASLIYTVLPYSAPVEHTVLMFSSLSPFSCPGFYDAIVRFVTDAERYANAARISAASAAPNSSVQS